MELALFLKTARFTTRLAYVFQETLPLAAGSGWPLAGHACDICGCFMGITPYHNQSGVSLMHRYRVFNGYQPLGQDPQFFPDGARPVAARPLNGAAAGYTHSHKGDPADFEAFRVVGAAA